MSRFRHLSQLLSSRLPRRDAIHLVGVELGLAAALTAGLAFAAAPDGRNARLARLTGGEMSAQAFARLTSGMDPAMLTLASRVEPRMGGALQKAGGVNPDALPEGAAADAAVIRLQDLDPDQARAWNLANPTSTLPNPAARPFKLKTGGMLDEARAIDCMTAAIYYEAAWESLDGQRAVAQVVLNRMRHPAFPKTVCGVVFQGSNRTTGCQFSFTCDGAMNRQPQEAAWLRARSVASASLNGFVMRKVGTATHYHANYVAAYWSPSLVKVGSIGAHIFYRWTGGSGLPPAFSGKYLGTEAEGMQIAALDRYATTPKIDASLTKDLVEEALPVEEAVLTKAPKGADGKSPSGGHEAPVAKAEELITVADAAKDAGALLKAEDLDWTGQPKRKGPPRLAMPGSMF
ncbi:cell wall hydrolase [Phenylobacterium sp.]|uniref:cell wall hydrolase n=1 Tax=Phenylobacterium sp. TaxID=1871053 RepID=UPI00271FE8DC|nr:cell wall hydrolase [Phenylobacterium sp.]MDO8379908.1 cell wall hydrolase [Phenylobacterium sp.]